MIQNIFLDAGGVILDESEFEKNSAEIITKLIKNYKNYSIENYWDDVNEAIYRFVPKVYDYILFKHINNIENCKIAISDYKESIKLKIKYKLFPGVEQFLTEFSKRYRIGILGQYGIEFKNFLEKQELLQYFTYTEIQDYYKMTKPDTRYFEAILKNCGCNAENSIMIGDRIDKDIIPAKIIGMKTIRIKTGIHKNQEPRIPEEIPDITVNSIEEIKIDIINILV